jgi:pimeloyl-ACP methyl ester carboxylesterase
LELPVVEYAMLRGLPITLIAIACFNAMSSADARQHAFGPQLEGFEYPYEVERFEFQSQGLPLSMAYLDVAPDEANGRTVVLLHGKNFCAATWELAIVALMDAGYRVVAPDQVGFCKSSKPQAYQFSLGQLAYNTHALLEELGIRSATIVGHSMGGMLAVRYALQYPQATTQLVLVNPIGLEDWKAEGVPWRSVDEWNARELKTDFASIKKYQQDVYYGGQWKPGYDRWVEMLAGMYAGPGKQAVAWSQALTSDMVFNQPVLYELPKLAVPTTLFIGQRDRTAIGKDLAPPDVAKQLGDYPSLGKQAAKAIPGAKLVEFADLGHSPQVEDPARFHAALLEALAPR